MTTATITRPAKTKNNRKKTRKNRTKKPMAESPDTGAKKCVGGAEACENCKVAIKGRKASKKKKPMYKLGSWRGAFKGTLDF